MDLADEIKSISAEEVFLHFSEDPRILRACLKTQAEEIATKLKRRRLGAHTVQIKVRYSDITTPLTN